jgi:flagellar hook protein FlgE
MDYIMSGFGNALNASLTGMNSSAKKTAIASNNIANANTTAYKRFEVNNSAIVSQDGVISGVDSTTRQLVDVQGEFDRTGISTDLAIDGNGFAIVTDGFTGSAPKNIFVTRDMSFRKDNTNKLVNSSGFYLLAWQVDADGNLPGTKSLLSSLDGVDIIGWTSKASATTEVEFAANLVPQQSVVGNSVGNINILNRGLKLSPINAYASSTDILYENPVNSLSAGEGLEVTIGNPDGKGVSTKKIMYGGFATTFSFSNSGTNLTTAVGGQLAGDTIQMSYGNQVLTVTRGSGATNRDVLQNIADQINATTPSSNGLQAQIFDLGTTTQLYISPTNINQSVTFSGTLAFRNQMGLDDSKNIPAFTPDIQGVTVGRFATLKQLATSLTQMGVTASVNDDPATGANLALSSSRPVAFNNYQPLGKNSDFLSEFGLPTGYLNSTYDSYLASNNMAGGSFLPHFSQNITVYDSMGNSHNILLGFLKTGINTWAVEVYAVDPLSVNIPGRTDGLLMASTITFDGVGNFSSIQPVSQSAYSNSISSPNTALGATLGQTFVVGVGSSSYTFTYGSLSAQSTAVSSSGTGLTGTSTDTLTINIGTSTYNIARGGGVNNEEVLINIANQINQTSGPEAARAKIISNALTGQIWLEIVAADSTQAVAFGQTGTLGTNLGITSANDIAANSFSTLYELAEQINTTQGPTSIRASVVPGSVSSTYSIKIEPINSNFYLSFGGTSAAINAPLGTGATQTIGAALGLQNTTANRQLVGLDQPLTVNWSNIVGANPSVITFNLGVPGSTSGMNQSSGTYSVIRAHQNGVSTGDLTGVTIDPEGWITASFSNTLTRKIYKIPVGDFANPNGLTQVQGNVFKISANSGPLNLKEAGMNGAGKFIPGAIEGSNVDLAAELSSLIEIQHTYQGSAKIMGVTDKLMERLLNAF